MTQLPEDRDWERLVERVDLDVQADELAAAERAMGELPAAQVAPLPPEWIEATVAKATADAGSGKDPVVTAPPAVRPVLGGGWWDGAKRFAAAVLAFVGAHSVASAATVGVAGGVVAVVIWSGAFSTRELPYPDAVRLLRSSPDEAVALSAVNKVSVGARNAIASLRAVQRRVDQEPALREAAERALADLRRILAGQQVSAATTPSEAAYSWAVKIAADPNASADDRLIGVQHVAAYAANGIQAIHSLVPASVQVEQNKHLYLAKLAQALQ